MAPNFAQLGAVSMIWLSHFTLSDASSLPLVARGVVPSTLPATWSYLGCYTDNVDARALAADTYTSGTAMTDESCMAFCLQAGYTYAGTEYSQECYCDKALSGTAVKSPETDCNMNCSGNTTEACGGSNRLNVFISSTPGPVANPGVNGWNYLGCYNDSDARTLAVGVAVVGGAGNMTVANCVLACAGYKYAGVEYSTQCFCDNVFENYGGPASDGSTQCDMTCSGNSTELCGGSYRLNMYGYHVTAATVTSTATSTSKSTTSTSSTKSTSSTTAAITSTSKSSTSTSSSKSTSTAKTSTSTSTSKSSTSTSTSKSSSTSTSASKSSNTTSTSKSSSSTSSTKTSQASTSPTSSTAAAATGWSYSGCYVDSVQIRTLKYGYPVVGGATNMTVENCQAACKTAGYTLAGIEYADECYCDNVFENGVTGPAPDGNAGCNMACSGNTVETCGGSNRLDVYTYGAAVASSTAATTSSAATSTSKTTSSATATSTGWNALGCYVDSVTARTLAYKTDVAGDAPMTIELCLQACQNAGYILAGVEYAQECYCDNVLEQGITTTAPDGNAGCNLACVGNAAEICGGSNRLNVYSHGAAQSVSSSTVKATSTSAVSTTTSAAATATASGWTYQGCWIDNAQGRIMVYENADDQTMTIEKCIGICSGMGYTLAGLQYSVQCFCDTVLRNGATQGTEASCNTACGGNAAETCGGPNRDSVWANGPYQVLQLPTNQLSWGSWTYQGCLISGMTPTPLRFGPQQRPNDNQASTCLATCQKFGYQMGGLEYGVECFCGDAADITASGATFAPDTDCSFACSGNPETLCGANNRISLYKWTGATPIYVWHYPTGNGLGAFNVLVTGPVVPLIATLGLNNKVTFMEKSGTSETLGSTGAYELDLSTLQYRTMHVKSDVFCSGSLTLPDKVGRQINVGGWSGDSTYGVRLYWPDGSAGVPGTNDWQENYQEVALAAGRWYPGAMIMANGSILVVGGEQGSNGAPTPSLELLPGGGGTLYMDWLETSNPYNLYPFLAVLPSGGIFVAYYQSARILDEKTFATTYVMPTIPGSMLGDVAGATDPAVIGGRTYPLEGTAVILPQYPPYTTPITVMLCGGGTPFGGPTLDNCVSIQPEVAGQDWVIERMPSQRVMSCMAALPDGTYLIVNGALIGVAGFQLASGPNHNALLYDPSKPVNQRISMLANTTIDRFYHSEAILLQDGTVLISGSDPETDGLVQEYRVEIFTPPYLIGNPARPSFTIPSGVKSYGYTDTITINVSGGAAKISLLGAVSSTHGNSMGQRTFFPAFTCNGATCTITTPPNAHVCPPGWFQLFILNAAGVPSLSSWVRIGGDPANLGSWPAGFADFTVPGPG